ncbi:MAG: helix-turn-helix domain-containing protein [bacterium]
MLTLQKREKIQGDPVPLFDNAPSDISPTFELLTIHQVAEFFQISVTSVRRLQQKREIPFIKVGGSVRFSASDILSYLKKGRVESVG